MNRSLIFFYDTETHCLRLLLCSGDNEFPINLQKFSEELIDRSGELLLVLARRVILGSESRRSHGHILLSYENEGCATVWRTKNLLALRYILNIRYNTCRV